MRPAVQRAGGSQTAVSGSWAGHLPRHKIDIIKQETDIGEPLFCDVLSNHIRALSTLRSLLTLFTMIRQTL